MPNQPLRCQIRGDVQRGAAPGSGSKAPAGAARSPARNARQASKSARESARPSARPCGPARRPPSTDHSPAQAMPMNCWQTTSSGAAIDPQRLDPAGAGGPGRDQRRRPARRASPRAAARARPRPGGAPTGPTRCTHRETPPGRPTWTVRSAVPMSTPSSRLVLVTTARSSPAFSAVSIARRRWASSAEWWAAMMSLRGPAGAGPSEDVAGLDCGTSPQLGDDVGTTGSRPCQRPYGRSLGLNQRLAGRG